MNGSIQSGIHRPDFQRWLDTGTTPLVITHCPNETTTILKLPKTSEIDYLYGWKNSMSFCGVYDQRSQKLYLADAPLTSVVDGITAEERQDAGAYAKIISGEVNRRVEAMLANGRDDLLIKEVTGLAARDLKYYRECGAKEEAIRRLFEDRPPDGQFRGDYALSSLPETGFIAWLQDPEQFVQTEAEQYIKSHQEHLLMRFLKNDALLAEYQALMQDTDNPVHRMKAITDAVKNCGAKTVTVTIRKSGEELTFKMEASYLLGQRNYYNASGIPAQDRRRFEALFGRHSDYNADDITKITYGRNTIYEAPAAPVEEMGPVMQMGGM